MCLLCKVHGRRENRPVPNVTADVQMYTVDSPSLSDFLRTALEVDVGVDCTLVLSTVAVTGVSLARTTGLLATVVCTGVSCFFGLATDDMEFTLIAEYCSKVSNPSDLPSL